jgi:arginyl-tRNA synthetase
MTGNVRGSGRIPRLYRHPPANISSTTVRTEIDKLLRDALAKLAAEGENLDPKIAPQVERTRDARHGDFTSNVAMRVAKSAGRPPRELAARIIERLPASNVVDEASVAGPGFINFRLAPSAYREQLRAILAAGAEYGRSETGAGKRVIVEYLSANPTGPLHVGHGRLAAYGASVANLLRATGHEVHAEYYVNDAGRQMEILAASVWLRYAELCGAALPFPDNAYQGAYVRDIAGALQASHGADLLGDSAALGARISDGSLDGERRLDALIGGLKDMLGRERFATILKAALDGVLADIRDDLEEFGVSYDNWYSEAGLAERGAVQRALETLRERGELYERDGATWFRSSEYGDEKDRVVIRENGVTTYFASDIAYHLEKRERGFDHLLDVLGADHHGYVARVRAGLQAMGQPADCLEAQLVQFVVLYRGRSKVQMSTRSGEYVTLRELREEVGNDAARFFYVSRSNDQHLEFDLELAKSQSNENPVYYVQYAHARVASMVRKMEEEGYAAPSPASVDLTALEMAEEHALMSALSRYPEVVQLASDNRAPQHLVHYLRDIAAAFHSYYNAHRVLVEDETLRNARVILALATQQVLRNALELLGVSAPERM